MGGPAYGVIYITEYASTNDSDSCCKTHKQKYTRKQEFFPQTDGYVPADNNWIKYNYIRVSLIRLFEVAASPRRNLLKPSEITSIAHDSLWIIYVFFSMSNDGQTVIICSVDPNMQGNYREPITTAKQATLITVTLHQRMVYPVICAPSLLKNRRKLSLMVHIPM